MLVVARIEKVLTLVRATTSCCACRALMPANGFSGISSISRVLGDPPHRAHTNMCGPTRPTSARRTAPSRTGRATSLWRVLAGMPSRQSSRSRSIMKARIRSRIGANTGPPAWPLGDAAPKGPAGQEEVGALFGQRRSTEEVFLPRADVREHPVGARVPEPAKDAERLLPSAPGAKERNLVASASPVKEDVRRRDRQGHAVRLRLEEVGDVTSQACSRGTRTSPEPPDGKEPRRLAWTRFRPENSAIVCRRPMGSGTSRASRRGAVIGMNRV